MRPEFGAVAGAILVFAFFSIVAGDRGFLAARGVSSWLKISAQLGILAIAAALLMIGGEFDLSIGSMIGAAGMVLAIPIAIYGWPLWAALLLAIAAALLVGSLTGLIVHRTTSPPLILPLTFLFILPSL